MKRPPAPGIPFPIKPRTRSRADVDLSRQTEDTFRRVLVATDGWPSSAPVIATGVALARVLEAPATIVHSMIAWKRWGPLRSLFPATDVPANPERLARAEDCLNRARIVALYAGVPFETRLAFDPDPVRAVLDAAHDTEASVLVLGADDTIDRLRPGHVIRRIVAGSRIPVLVVPRLRKRPVGADVFAQMRITISQRSR